MKDYIENCRNYFESPAFYRRPLENSLDNELWFSQQPIGLSKLSSFNKTMFLEAGIPGYYTNYSGSAHLRQHAVRQASRNKKLWKGRTIFR